MVTEPSVVIEKLKQFVCLASADRNLYQVGSARSSTHTHTHNDPQHSILHCSNNSNNNLALANYFNERCLFCYWFLTPKGPQF